MTPVYCRIVAIGMQFGNDQVQSQVVGKDNATEVELLTDFWEVAARSSSLVGYNIAQFDLPVIYVRSRILGIKPTRKIDTKPWGGQVIDLMQTMFPRGASMKLKDLARILGFTIPAEDVDGSEVFELWQAGKLDEIAKYQASDIEVTRQLFDFQQGFFF